MDITARDFKAKIIEMLEMIIPRQRIQILLCIGSIRFSNGANCSQNRSTLTFA